LPTTYTDIHYIASIIIWIYLQQQTDFLYSATLIATVNSIIHKKDTYNIPLCLKDVHHWNKNNNIWNGFENFLYGIIPELNVI